MAQFAITAATPVLIATGGDMAGQWVSLRTMGNEVWLGGATVSPTTGLHLDVADGIKAFALDDGEKLYAICSATETATVETLSTG